MAKQPETNSPTDVTHHLKGVHFPASRDDLVAQARKNGADPSIMARVEGLPDEEYGTIAEVMKGFGAEVRDQK